MSLKNRKEGKKSFWLAALPANTFAQCPDCDEVKPIDQFWLPEQYRMGKSCCQCTTAKVTPRGYHAYMKSPEWRQKRLEYWKSKKMRHCFVCLDPWVNFKGKQLHHRTYERLGNESLDDLVPVCAGCHDEISEAWVMEKRLPYKERRTLWEVTEYVASCHAEGVYMSNLGS